MGNLVKKLRAQHAEMIELLSAARNNALRSTGDRVAIVAALNNFKKVLVDHLYLENKYLYPAILETEIASKPGIMSVKLFLGELISEQTKLINFLNKYDDPERLNKNSARFKRELPGITQAFKTRIRLEEEGLFKCL